MSAVVALAVLAAVHVASAALRLLRFVPRARLLSMAGGVAVAFVFLQLLPALATDQALVAAGRGALPLVPRGAYLAALAGLVLTYSAGRALRSRSGLEEAAPDGALRRRLFWFSLATYALLNAVVGYLVVRGAHPYGGRLAFTVAMALKFVVTDRGLVEDHQELFDRVGRVVAIAALGAGALLSWSWTVPRELLAALRAFLAGGILLNVLKEELPEERDSSFPVFVLSTSVAAVVLLLL